MKNILFLEHIPFEGPAFLLDWAAVNNFNYNRFFFYKDKISELPKLKQFDILIIIGGTMNIYEENLFPWLKEEKDFIKSCIKENKKILGLCLGDQLIADCFGYKVTKNPHKEKGIFPVTLTDSGKRSSIFKGFPDQFYSTHWHGDTFSIPENKEPLCSSKACANQAFLFNENTLALQFHIEVNPDLLKQLCKNDPPQKDIYIQSASEILTETNFTLLHHNTELLHLLMANFLGVSA